MAWGVGEMFEKCPAGAFNVIAYVPPQACCMCREPIAMGCVCGWCGKYVCVACLPRHSGCVTAVEDTDHVATDDDRECSDAE